MKAEVRPPTEINAHVCKNCGDRLGVRNRNGFCSKRACQSAGVVDRAARLAFDTVVLDPNQQVHTPFLAARAFAARRYRLVRPLALADQLAAIGLRSPLAHYFASALNANRPRSTFLKRALAPLVEASLNIAA